jgi:sulfite reductase alpha subunit-like flavoprotein
MGQQRRSALITFGSETGNAQNIAEELGRMVERLHFVVHITALDSVAIQSLRGYDVVLVAISTTGQGDLPLNARVFWKSLLRKRLPPDLLQGVNFTSFGLGDSSYPR